MGKITKITQAVRENEKKKKQKKKEHVTYAEIRKKSLTQYHFSLRKRAFSNKLKILSPKNENFQMKNSDIFHISAQNIDCGYSLEPPRRGGSNEYPQSMF